MIIAGGIDLGGTKIEASVFDADWQPVETRRVSTPRDSYDDLLTALAGQVSWLRETSDNNNLPLGIGTPGIFNIQSGLATTANLPANGMPLRADLSERIGTTPVFANDCDMFALSEAVLGAGRGHASVFGLILGTGTGGGFVQDGHLVVTRNGAGGEVGHLGIPMDLAQAFDLPLMKCGCGRSGCYETLVSGPGLQRIHAALGGNDLPPAEISKKAANGCDRAALAVSRWHVLLADLIHALQVTYDMDCVVLGGGLSNMTGLVQGITEALPDRVLTGAKMPAIKLADYGDSSGTRGAALAGYQAWQEKT